MAASNIQPLIDEVKAEETIADSTAAWINGSKARMDQAVADALALGATQAELKPLTDEIALQHGKMQAVADALVANTPVTPPAP